MPLVIACLIVLLVSTIASAKELLWGDTHLHTSYSFAAFLNGNMDADPSVAYRFAKGQPVCLLQKNPISGGKWLMTLCLNANKGTR
jgi:hypothetical protein